VNINYDILDWFGPSCGVIVLRQVLMYYDIEIGSSLFLSGSLKGVIRYLSGCPSGCPRYRSILSIYSQVTASYSLTESRL
jgi:hypothetical protein